MNKKILIICICLIGSVLARDLKPMLPFYKLPIGKNLIYNSISEFKGANYISGSNTKTQFWVWKQNPDGSSRLIICRTVKNYRILEDSIRKEEEPQTIWAYCDLFPDGRITENVSLQNFNPSQYFIPLPNDAVIAKQSWEQFDSTNQERTHYQLGNKNLTDSVWIVRITKQTPFDSIYIISSHSLIYINLKVGLAIKKESEALQGYGYSAGKTTALTILDSIKPLDTLKFKPFINELLAYFQTESAYNQILDKVEYNAPDANSLMASAESILNDAYDTANDSTIQALLNDDMTNHEQIKNSLIEDSSWFAKTIDKKAVEWKLKDLSEKTHTLKQYREKIVILDFWYRGCPWCIRAMPMINQIAKDFKDQPVVVFGMNVDKNKDDVLFVTDKLKLIYPSLQASGIDKQYEVTGFPTLFIIDKKGIIRDAHIGYSPDLGTKVTKKIESLLGKK
jgi:thiol-disulfide isomerase/thioredoxin